MVLYSGLLLYKHIHAHRINAMKSFAKLNKLEEHTSLTNAHISTTKKIHCTVLILKRKGICERVTLSLLAEIV